MVVRYDTDTDAWVVDSEECPHCEEALYHSGCDAPGCNGLACQDCGTGCDLDFAPEDDSRCAAAIADEDPADRLERHNKERAALGLEPEADDEAVAR